MSPATVTNQNEKLARETLFLIFKHVLFAPLRPKAASAERVASRLARRPQRSRLGGDSVRTKQMAYGSS